MRTYKSVAEAIANDTACKFAFPFSFQLPPLPAFPPSIPIPTFSFSLPTIPVICPLDDSEEDQ